MKKEEITIVVLLFVLLLAWGYFQRTHLVPVPKEQEDAVSDRTPASSPAAVPGETMPHGGERSLPALADREQAGRKEERIGPVQSSPDTVIAAVPDEAGDDGRLLPEKTVVLANDKANVTISSWGGAITRVELKNFRATSAEDSGPVTLDFSDKPALSLTGVPGLSTNNDFKVSLNSVGKMARVERKTALGLCFERTITIVEDYNLKITDVFSNDSPQSVALSVHGLWIGPMQTVRTKAKTREISYLGLDTLAVYGGDNVQYWGRKNLPALFGYRASPLSCARPNVGVMPAHVSRRVGIPVAWVAAKNKFFVQILAPEGGSLDCELRAGRDVESSKALVMSTVSAIMYFQDAVIEPGEALKRETSYYVGPKNYSLLKELGNHQDEVMEFGFFKWFCKILLATLNAIYSLIPNYGIAIILLTVIIRILFWPITHKSTESMKKMQKLQPLIKELQQKYKDKPQKLHQEQMALYKEHKVNPMMGCLPMLIQIPVFFAFFTVLRSAVELRFASFLWVRDLSEQEGLFDGMVPIVGSLNILPLFMTATTIWQQKLTPSTGDPQQQRMMTIMPIVFLFIFYSMPSALVLYWSVSQCLSIAQLLIQRRKSAG